MPNMNTRKLCSRGANAKEKVRLLKAEKPIHDALGEVVRPRVWGLGQGIVGRGLRWGVAEIARLRSGLFLSIWVVFPLAYVPLHHELGSSVSFQLSSP